MIAQRRILLAALGALCLVFFGIRLDRALIDQAPKVFMATPTQATPANSIPSAFFASTGKRQRARANRLGGGSSVPTLPQIFGAPAGSAFSPDPGASAPGGGSFAGPVGASVLPTVTQPGPSGSGAFIGLPGGGGPGGGVGGGLSPSAGTPGGGGTGGTGGGGTGGGGTGGTDGPGGGTSGPGGGGSGGDGGVVVVPPPIVPNPGGGTPGGTLPDPGPPAVPEPETWAMIMLGLLVTGVAARRHWRGGYSEASALKS